MTGFFANFVGISRQTAVYPILNAIMKRQLSSILAAFLILCGIATAQAENFFVYPTPPDSMSTLQQRADYYVSRFWDRCDFGAGVKNPHLVNKAFGDWISLMPHASADTVHAAIATLLSRFEKKGPETLLIASSAENWMWSDTASFISDEIYLPFAKAAATNKKISKADKARFAAQTKILESSGNGKIVPDFRFTRPDGSKGSMNEIGGSSVLIFFNDLSDIDCNLARVRLGSDFNARELIASGQLTVICRVYTSDAADD